MWLPRASGHASEVFVTNCDIDWGSESLLADCLDSTGDFIDVGAHIGYYSLYMLPRVRSAHAFEPDPRVLPSLERNLGPYQNTKIVRAAVAEAPGERKFQLGHTPEVSSLRSDGDAVSGGVTVKTTTIDHYV